ncbi:hypothetical protein ZIOFF_055388 [Zingiber officinale]|uniref:F-box domain-containing protein n=1 Tax=Zingiber officinale TaxID=94328 RepID=A0A8J5FLP4_ZINOF|nr:hypothetical protein ZIOFF_055388 [Zingiber officinale]
MANDDVSVEILTRLPLKSLFRFKCVSKAWHGLISNDDYLRRRLPLLTSAVFYHCSAANREPRFACTSNDAGELRECGLEFFPLHGKSDIVDCCGGLLLAYSASSASFYVLSPITKRWAGLPPARRTTLLSVLAFDSYHSKGYKVVSFAGWLPQGSQIEVFSSSTGGWAERRVHWGIDSDSLTASLRYFAGILYVLAYPHHIVAIDLDDDALPCRLIDLPVGVKPGACVDRSGGRLHYACEEEGRIKVWALEGGGGGGGGWALRYSVDADSILRRVPGNLQQKQLHLLAVHPEREGVVYLRTPGRIVAYDLGKEELGEICEFRKEEEKEEKKTYLVQIWVFPFSRYMSDCLAN